MTAFRQLEQRHVSSEIAMMEWNPMLDLIALATDSGEILLHRLSWQKVWSIPSHSTKEKNVSVTALAWRPDGKILAYAYDNGKVTLCDVENSEPVHLLDVHCIVTSLTWIQCEENGDPEHRAFYTDKSEEILQKHYAFNKGYASTSKHSEEVADDFKRLKGQKELNVLAIGMETGMVHLHSFGMFPTGFIDLNIKPRESKHDRVISITMSKDFRLLTVILERRNEGADYAYYYRSFHISLLYDCMEEIKIVSLKFGQVSSLLTYLSSTIRAISEAWEDILLEVDTKLHNYAMQKSGSLEGSISDDFLELLMFGNPSDSLEKFLLHDLTESGLKKFGHSIELSYSNIQKLVLKRLQNVSCSLFYHLSDLKAIAAWKERFGPLGLDEAVIQKSVLGVGSFLIKAIEIQQVIDKSMKNFKAFFRWLYSVILRLSDEPIPLEISKLTQQDLQFVAEFLKENFTFEYLEHDERKKSALKLERVAQYLKKEDLAFPPSTVGNPWIKFLKDHPSMVDSKLVFPYYPEKSLVTVYADLRKIIDGAVKGPWVVLQKTTTARSVHKLSHKNKLPPKISHQYCSETQYLYTVVTDTCPPCSKFYLIREKFGQGDSFEAVGANFLDFQEAPSCSSSSEATRKFLILDIKFYSKDLLTVLLIEDFGTESNCPVLLQLPVKNLCSSLKSVPAGSGTPFSANVPVVNASRFVEKGNYKRLENVKASAIAVSGSRKVVCVLFASRRQVRLFEMDVDDEEEEDETEDSIMKDASKDNLFLDEDLERTEHGRSGSV